MKFINKIIEKFKYGIFLQSVFNILRKIGIEIVPNYWVKESRVDINVEEKEKYSDYSFGFFNLDEICMISGFKNDPYREWIEKDALQKRLDDGNKCFGVKYNNEIVAFLWIDLEKCESIFFPHQLKKNEAYIFDVYIVKNFRGKRLASYMRNQAYQVLSQEDIDTFYSLCNIFNTPSIKSKKRLDGKFLNTILYIRLFRKYSWQWIFKRGDVIKKNLSKISKCFLVYLWAMTNFYNIHIKTFFKTYRLLIVFEGKDFLNQLPMGLAYVGERDQDMEYWAGAMLAPGYKKYNLGKKWAWQVESFLKRSGYSCSMIIYESFCQCLSCLTIKALELLNGCECLLIFQGLLKRHGKRIDRLIFFEEFEKII